MPSPPAPAFAAGSSSASTIAADTETGSHELTISGYSGTKGLGVGKFIRSSVFSIGGHSWCIRYYPDGEDKERADWISVYLEREDDASDDVKVRFRFSLLDQVGEAVPLYTFTSDVRTFTSENIWGYEDFIKREDLESSSHLKGDSFRISCHVTVVNFNVAERNTLLSPVPPSMDLHLDLGELLKSKIGADVKFKVGKKTFKAHRSVLASRSSVFKAELFGFMKEIKKATQIQIKDIEARVFWAIMLHFIYTDSLPEIDEDDRSVMAQHLLVAADRYSLHRLKQISEDVLCKFIDINTAATTLALAEQHGCRRLKEGCLNFLKYPGNMKAVIATDGFGHLTSSCPSLLHELLAKLSP
ncbi:unnamed protein product [Urochloa decumbens]|uniref:Uncharacterized protein n=1 Tax=Urochloa decumbens TaxID=240449 RepID=A0ABC9B6J6_9POAL